MGGYQKTNTFSAHDNAVNAAESTRQGVQATAAMSPSGQAALNAGEIAYFRAVIASCKANNNSAGMSEAILALRALGVTS